MRTSAGRRLLEVSALSPLQFVEQEFEHPTIKAGLLFFNGLREVDLRLPGFGHHIAALLASPAKAQMSRGGSAALARALEAAVRESGGEIRLMTEPKRILVEGGRAVGIETADGRVDPRPTFRGLVAQSAPDVSRPARRRRWCRATSATGRGVSNTTCWRRSLPCISISTQPPRYRASADHPELAQAFMVIMGLDHVDQFGEIVRHHEAGTIPPTVMWGACPTLFDPSQAPPGRHTAFMWEKLPYRLHGDPDNWDRLRDEHGRAMLALWQQHAPNLADAVDRLVHAQPARRRALPAQHARGRPAGRRLRQRPGRLSPAVRGRGRLPHPPAGPLPLRLDAPIPAATSPGFPPTTRRR